MHKWRFTRGHDCVKRSRKIKKQSMENPFRIMDRDSASEADEINLRKRCREYFESLHNIVSNKEVIITA